MIIIDLSQLCFSNMTVLLDKGDTLDEHEFRVMVLNSLRKNISAFKKEYGKDVVIACDTGTSWRKDFYPYYKAARKKARDDSSIDWELMFKYFNNLKDELAEYTNYKVIRVDRAEADDVISHFCHEHGVYLGDGEFKIVIISGDKDMSQLQKFSNVFQFDPVSKKKIVLANPAAYLVEHIVKGDRGDGIPNSLSDDDTFVTDKRQVTMTKGRLETLLGAINDGTIDVPGYFRNRTLIDLSFTPKEIREKIADKYIQESTKGKRSLMAYFAKFRIKELFDLIGDF